MAKKIQIDFVSDVVCPWCAIGLSSLEIALKKLEGEIEAEVHFQPFELNPDMAPEGENRDAYIAAKYGRSPDQIQAGRDAIRERAAAVGFTMNAGGESLRRAPPAALGRGGESRPSGGAEACAAHRVFHRRPEHFRPRCAGRQG
jgi:predicted DsbA family dithiol-disulfide isomerase